MTKSRFRSGRTPSGASIYASIDAAKADAQRAGHEVIDLSAGSSDLPAPPEAVEALAASAMDASTYKYCMKSGTLPLLEAAVVWYKEQYSVQLSAADQALALIGAQEGLGHLLLSAADSGDGIVMSDVGFPSYFGAVQVAGLHPIYVPLDAETLLPDFDQLSAERLRAGRAKVMLLNYPNNPTSATADDAFFERAIAFAKEHNLLLIHDSPYIDLTFDQDHAPSPLALPGGLDCCVEIFTFSKSYHVPGLRLGFMLGNADAIGALAGVKAVMDFNQWAGIQRAGIACLRLPRHRLRSDAATWQARAKALSEALLQHAGWDIPMPRSCMYLWGRLPEALRGSVDDVRFAVELLTREGVAVAPGSAFGPGGAGFVRFALVAPEGVLEEVAQRVGRVVAALAAEAEAVRTA